MTETLTDAELVLLGLLAEQPRHAYELETVIDERGVRAWTALGFSSIYYVLTKLERRGLLTSEQPVGQPKGRRTYTPTPAGLRACTDGTRAALEHVTPVHASVLVGMANSPLLTPAEVAAALRTRRERVVAELGTVESTRARQEPLEWFVGAIFEHGAATLRAELTWIDHTLTTLEEHTMTTYDLKKAHPALYAPKAGDFHEVDVPELAYLMVDGHGDPNTTPAYAQAVQALFTVSYTVRALAKAELGRVHTVGPLEALWSADDPAVFVSGDKSAWDWTAMIAQPDWITPELVDRALATARAKGTPAVDLVRFERLTEGRSVQVLHVGPYDAEAPTLARLHHEYLPVHGLTFAGRHHEVYLSDARRTDPVKLRTVLRQPVAPAP
jgi:DNA-binding PadR family transcriptional regulator